MQYNLYKDYSESIRIFTFVHKQKTHADKIVVLYTGVYHYLRSSAYHIVLLIFECPLQKSQQSSKCWYPSHFSIIEVSENLFIYTWLVITKSKVEANNDNNNLIRQMIENIPFEFTAQIQC